MENNFGNKDEQEHDSRAKLYLKKEMQKKANQIYVMKMNVKEAHIGHYLQPLQFG